DADAASCLHTGRRLPAAAELVAGVPRGASPGRCGPVHRRGGRAPARAGPAPPVRREVPTPARARALGCGRDPRLEPGAPEGVGAVAAWAPRAPARGAEPHRR